MKTRFFGLIFMLGFVAACGVVKAGEDEIGALRERVNALERANPRTSPSWTDMFSFNGRVRVRLETIVDDTQPDYRERGRIAAALGVVCKPNDEIKAGLSLSTGGNDPVGTNVDMGSAFSRKSFTLQTAFIDYSPKAVAGLDVIGGKMDNPFITPAGNQLIWGCDLRPEGLAATYKTSFKPIDVYGAAGVFVVQERSSAADTVLYGFQGVGSWDLNLGNETVKDCKVWAGLGYYDFGAIQGRSAAGMSAGGFGNTLVGGNYANDFNEAEVFMAGDVTAWNIPFRGFFDFAINTGAGSQKTGWQVGLTAGKLAEPGSWDARINYRDLKKNAVLGQFTDADFAGGGTDGRGIEMGFDYMVLKNTTLSMTLFADTKNVSSTADGYTCLQADVQVKF
jgi:hypothetical protein